MTQKHTDHTEERQHHPAPKHEDKHEEHRTERHADEQTDKHATHTPAHEHKDHAKSSAPTVKVGNREIEATNLTPEDRKYIEQYADELSPTTLRAKWINKIGETEGHPGQTLATRNPEVIKRWAEECGGTPATVPGTEHGGELGVLRINFPGYGGKDLQPVSWDQWLATFKNRKLVFLFQQNMRNGHQSNFFHMDSPVREHD
jgi:hypothetical protein